MGHGIGRIIESVERDPKGGAIMRWTLLVCLFCFAAGVWAGDVGRIKAAA